LSPGGNGFVVPVLDSEPVIFCNQARLPMEALGHQPSHKTFLDACVFSNGRQKGVSPDERGGRGVERPEYIVVLKNIFLIEEKITYQGEKVIEYLRVSITHTHTHTHPRTHAPMHAHTYTHI
jgi:hypothetical protein